VGDMPQSNYARRLAWEANQPPDPNREYQTDYERGYKRGASDCRGIVDKLDALAAQRDELYVALIGLLNVVAADELIPESVSYMRQARAAVAACAAGQAGKEPG
jgi:hypothetical protein